MLTCNEKPKDILLMTYVVALTGGIGSGKSTVAEAFANLGVPLIDADVIARQVVQLGTDALSQIVTRYGNNILLADGSLNRAVLRQKIFSEQQERAWLNSLLHPLIQQETQRRITATKEPYLIWVIPLLIENNLFSQADRVLLVDVDKGIQLTRIISRDNITRQQAKQILSAQTTQKERLACADDVINNNGNFAELSSMVSTLHQQYLDFLLLPNLTKKF